MSEERDPIERTFVLIKPDALRRAMIGRIISRIEDKGLTIISMAMLPRLKAGFLCDLYREHVGQEHWGRMYRQLHDQPGIALAVEGRRAVEVMRSMVGYHDGAEAVPGTIRGDFSLDLGLNLIHAAATVGDAEREAELFSTAVHQMGGFSIFGRLLVCAPHDG